MKFKNLITEAKESVLTITINRPDKLNALNKETLEELSVAVQHALADDSVGGLIITGSGPKAFVAGADISELASLNQKEGEELARKTHKQVFDLIAHATKPIIAAVNGFALGGGLELAMACQIRIASDTAKLGLPEVTLGLIPGYGGTQRLTQLVGKGKAFEMILTANMIDAFEAYRIGLVNKVVSPTQLLPECSEMLKVMLSRSPNALASAIAAINASADNQVNGFDVEIEEFGKCFQNDDFRIGVDAFLKKEKPIFRK